MKKIPWSAGVIVVLLLIFWQTGCRQKDGNPISPQLETSGKPEPNNPLGNGAVNLSFQFIPPPSIQSSPNAAIVSATGVTPQVTFKLSLINIGNTANPITVLSKTVPAVNGVASAGFQALPVISCIGDIHIEGGKMGSYSDFHGALDLKSGSNTLFLAGKGSKATPDFVAFVMEKVLTTPSMSAKIVSGMAEKVTNSILNLNTGLLTAYDDAVNSYLAYSIETTPGQFLKVGDVLQVGVGTQTNVILATPSGSETFGVVFYPVNTANGSYAFDVNGGGPLLSIKAPSASVQPGRGGLDQRTVDQEMRKEEWEMWHAGKARGSLAPKPNSRISGAVSETAIGDRVDFWVAHPSLSVKATTTCELRVIGTTCKIFRDLYNATDSAGKIYSSAATTDALLHNMADEFDSKIYPFITSNYGNTFDKNGDGKITIVFSPRIAALGTLGGYFSSRDLYDTNYSNQRDMFYVRTLSGAEDLESTKSTLTHEFQHLVNHVEHAISRAGPPEESWLNEGLSVEAQWRYSFSSDLSVNYYGVNSNNIGITYWQGGKGNYGADGLFLRYIYEQLGTGTIRSLVQTNVNGVANLDTNCSSRNGFAGLFKDWTAAIMRNGKNLPANSRFDYLLPISMDGALQNSTTEKKFGEAFSDSLIQTACRFIQLEPPSGFIGTFTTLQIRTDQTSRLYVTIVRLNDFYRGVPIFW